MNEEAQTAKFKYDVFFYGPEGYDEHVGIQAESAEEMSKGRDATMKALADIKAKPKGGPNGPRAAAYPAPTGQTAPAAPVSPAPATANVQQATGITKVCPVHGTPMRPNTRGGVPGVTTHAARSGKTYTCFWVCTTDQNCKER